MLKAAIIHFTGQVNNTTNCAVSKLIHLTQNTQQKVKQISTRMWANAQRDGHPAEYRRRPLFNAAKFGWRPILECCAVTLPRRETRWNLQGCPELQNRSQPQVGWSSSYCGNMWRKYCRWTSFFSIVDMCLSCKDIARQSCAMVPRWRILTTFCVLYLQRARCSVFQTCILNSH